MQTPIRWILFLAGVATALCCGGCGSDSTPQLVGWAVGAKPDNKSIAVLKTVDGIAWRNISSATFRGAEGRNVSAIDNQCAWISIITATGTPGQVVRTLDGGATWKDVTPKDLKDNFPNVKAVSRDIAWVGAAGYLGYTTDGGQNWTPIIPEGHLANATYSYTHLDALDAQHVWAVGSVTFADNSSATLVDRTRDGKTWQTMSAIPKEVNLLGLAVAEPDTVMVTVQSILGSNFYKSVDGGTTWSDPVNLGTGDLNDAATLGKYVWAIRDYAGFFMSSDNGTYFTSQALPDFGDRSYRAMWLLGISALDRNRIWISGESQTGDNSCGLLWTDDGGNTWHEPNPNLHGYRLWRISFVGGVK
jgi:photosystem II stability/assembly factor-like uncharacterized protein